MTIHTLRRPISAPELYKTENLSNENKLVVEHYFLGSADWFVIEYDKAQDICFGYARILENCGEFGYFSMKELDELAVESLMQFGGLVTRFRNFVERDEFWSPTPVAEVLNGLD